MSTLEGYVEGMINLSGGGGGGTSDYEDLENKPSINNVTLSGNKTTSDLNLSYNDLINKPYINNMPPSTGADIGDVLTHTSDGDEWVAPAKELPAISAADEGKTLTVSNGEAVWGSSGGINYSTDEQVIGTWIDGKPLYRKTINVGAMSYGTTWVSIAHNVSNIENVIDVYGQIYNSEDPGFFSIPQFRPNTNKGISVSANTTNVIYLNNWLQAITKSTITFEYTKTTD